MKKLFFFFIYVTISYLLFPAFSAFANEAEEVFSLRYHDGGKRDPFIPLIGKNIQIQNVEYLESVDDAHVEGILMDPHEGSVVIINGQVLKAEDFIGGFRVDSIQANSVVLSREGQSYTIDLNEGNK